MTEEAEQGGVDLIGVSNPRQAAWVWDAGVVASALRRSGAPGAVGGTVLPGPCP
jgi:hypothetical protein